ncbi:MAG TPA: peptidoglycan DD-metalloendopeptidase family protein [Anaerolineales bacterium]|nr:peptidoglycan DD-metalloendopeptidase family protein [Anaerolineales bacterium]
MKPKHNLTLWLLLGVLTLLVTISCSVVSQIAEGVTTEDEPPAPLVTSDCPSGEPGPCNEPVPLPSSTPEAAVPAAPTQTVESPPAVEATATEAPPAPAPAQPSPCEEEVCISSAGFWLERPIAPPGRDIIDVSYRFGNNDRGKRDTHHGVEFLNSMGTPVLAAADGVVVIAGDDLDTIYGLYRNFYGSFVVLEHQLPALSQPVYTLYAHLSQFFVKKGDTVEAGQKIGEVGSTGAATGSHLHFEVRYGENNYFAARNPELWLAALPDRQGQPTGAIAGRILDSQGKVILIPNIVVERLSGPGLPASDTFYVNSYAEKKLTGLEPWFESFALGGLPPGEYQITFIRQGFQQRIVQVQSGQLTLVTFRLDE